MKKLVFAVFALALFLAPLASQAQTVAPSALEAVAQDRIAAGVQPFHDRPIIAYCHFSPGGGEFVVGYVYYERPKKVANGSDWWDEDRPAHGARAVKSAGEYSLTITAGNGKGYAISATCYPRNAPGPGLD